MKRISKMKKASASLLFVLTMLALVACGEYTPTTESQLEGAFNAVKAAYGESYAPDSQGDEEYIRNVFKLESDDYDAFIAEMPLIYLKADCFVGFDAAEGKREKVLDAVKSYADFEANEALQYPMNMSRVQNAVMYEKDDYIFYFILGESFEPDQITEEDTPETEIAKETEFYKKQGQIGIDALDKFFAE